MRAVLYLCLLAANICISTVTAADVCYDDVGCFTTDYPYSDLMRPFPNLPQPPEKINTKFRLYTRNSPAAHLIEYNGTDFGDFSAQRKTMIASHGFNDDGHTGWLIQTKNLMLQMYDYNIILVDWGAGATIPYLQATANTQLVGRQIALLVAALTTTLQARPADFHLVAHSLGCHVMGYAGERIPGLGRITGLDPAQPYFEDTQPEVRLDPTDAGYVDIIHSDGRDTLFLGAGFTKACGHVDFFPNGGKNQPGCGDFDAEIEGLIWDLEEFDFAALSGLLGCSHFRSHQLFVDSLQDQNCPFVAFHCRDYSDYLNVECQSLQEGNIGRVGMDSINFNLNGSYYLQTTSDSGSLCVNYYEVIMTTTEDQVETQANMVFILDGTNGTSERLKGWRDHVKISAGLATFHTTLHTGVKLGNLTSLQLTYHDHNGVNQRQLKLASMEIRTVDTRLQPSVMHLCSDIMALSDKETGVFVPCG